MFKFIFLLVLTLSAFRANAHQYFFAFAELEYNAIQEKFEGTLIFSAHDLEDVLMEKGIVNAKFDKVLHDSTTIASIGQELFRNFHLTHKTQKVTLIPVDFRITENGLLEFYFSSTKVQITEAIDVEFSNLMDEFPQQQNKITFIYHGKKQTVAFLNDKRKQKLTIE